MNCWQYRSVDLVGKIKSQGTLCRPCPILRRHERLGSCKRTKSYGLLLTASCTVPLRHWCEAFVARAFTETECRIIWGGRISYHGDSYLAHVKLLLSIAEQYVRLVKAVAQSNTVCQSNRQICCKRGSAARGTQVSRPVAALEHGCLVGSEHCVLVLGLGCSLLVFLLVVHAAGCSMDLVHVPC